MTDDRGNLSLKIPAADHRRLAEYAEDRGVSIAEAARECIREHPKRQKAQDRGVKGLQHLVSLLADEGILSKRQAAEVRKILRG